ncbi:MAG: endonuclease/exonuclease/phosphatase family protein [Pirellulaceae bacterium]
MRKLFTFLILAGSLVGGAYFALLNGIIKIEGLDEIGATWGSAAGEADSSGFSAPPVQHNGDSIRVASFNIQVFGESKSNKPHVMDILARIVRRFDIVAVQEVRAKDQSIVPQFVDLINQTGRQYDWAISPRIGRTVSKEQYVYIFDRASVEIDRNSLYVVDDPDDLLHREPYVASFRVRGPPSDQAFTFTLVNIHTDPDETKQELDVLDDVFRAVRNDGRGEDDVIILGDLNVDDEHLGELGRLAGVHWVISHTPTNVLQTAQYDNLVFQSASTREFTGRGGVFDFMREYNLTSEQAAEVSDHLPVWAEFHLYEGGQPGRVAELPRGSNLN